MNEQDFSFHPFDEREFRDRFLPAVWGTAGEGDEDIVRELLDAANAAGPSWTALHKLFDETRVAFKPAVETEDGGAAQQTLFAAFAQFIAHLRPAFIVQGFGLTSIDRREFPELTSFIKGGGTLLMGGNGQPVLGFGQFLPSRVPDKCLPGRSGGGVVLAKDIRPMLDRFREDMPRLAEWAAARDLPAEAGITMILAALVEAKLKKSALIEASGVLEGDVHLDPDHRLTHDRPDRLPHAVLREAGKVFGRELPPTSERVAKVVEAVEDPPVAYSPQGMYEVGQRLEHKSFGEGEVVAILDSRRLRVQFAEDEKTLIQGLPKRPDV